MELEEQIYELVKQSHNPNLIEQCDFPLEPNYNKNTSPCSNSIYHLYNDGEITSQKGAWAYLDRSEFIIEYGIGYKFDINRFPKQCGKTGYAIVTSADANKIRRMMLEYKKSL